MKVFWKIFGYFMGVAGAIGLVIKVYSYTESLKPQSITKEEVKEIITEEISPQLKELKTGQETIYTIQQGILYNQNVLTNDFFIHIAHDSTALKIIELKNELKPIVEKKNSWLIPYRDINLTSEVKR
jgi:hypothetical protein